MIRRLSVITAPYVLFPLGHPKLEVTTKSRENTPFDSFNVDSKSLYVMKSGCQQLLKHRIPQTTHIINGNNVRYSLSFRRFTPECVPLREHSAHVDGYLMPSCVRKTDICLLPGDSHFVRLDADRLGKGKIKVLNISKGGSKIRDTEKAIADFCVKYSNEQNVRKYLCPLVL